MEDGDSLVLNISPTDHEENRVYEIVRIFSNALDRNDLAQIRKILPSSLLENKEVSRALCEETLQSVKNKNEFRHQVTHQMLSVALEEYRYNNSELLFLAAATFNTGKLKEVIGKMKEEVITYSENINQTRHSDSVITFMLKYCDVANEKFLECITILVNAGVNINKFDIKGRFPIDYITFLYNEYTKNKTEGVPNIEETLKQVTKLFLEKQICAPDNNKTIDFLKTIIKIDTDNYIFATMDDQTKLFYYIIKNKTDNFLATPRKIVQAYKDVDTEENTLLQLASRRTDNMLPIVQFLLKNGANPNIVTKWNTYTPLELAAKNNNLKIFEELLKHKKTSISQNQYNNFVIWRSQPMKVKLFEILLESDKLDPSFVYDKTGNTPLHYAIIFSHKKAIQNLLKRRSSLVEKNKFNKCALDMIDSEDLEKFFDSCLALDNYTPYFTDVNYKMRFRFNCLVDSSTSREVKVVYKIGKHPNLEHLLTHPFIHTFITLKWFKIKLYLKIILFLQALIFLVLSFLFYRPPNRSDANFYLCILLVVINIILKTPVFLYFKIKNRRPVFFALGRASLHGSTEILLMITTIGSFFQNQFRAFLFIEMAVSFLLTAGYHPKLSKWSLMLQRVFKTFSILLIFFSLLIIAFSLGFHILFPGDSLFQEFYSAVFRTYIMTTGEFNADEDLDLKSSGFAGYILFVIFAMSMALVVVNFWTGVAVTDIERIEKNSEINACKNVTIFILFIDYIYANKYFKYIRKYIPNPLLFLNIDNHGLIYHNPEKCEINFYVNKDRQFEEKGSFPPKVDPECFNKIRSHYYKLAKVTTEQQVLKKLEELSKTINELKLKFQKSGSESDLQPKRDFRKQKGRK